MNMFKRKINPDMSSLMQRHQLQLTAVKRFRFFEIICILVKEILLDWFCLFLYFLLTFSGIEPQAEFRSGVVSLALAQQ